MHGVDTSPAATGPWPAPAKLNLFLHVTGRRPDGYHLLQTAFQFLDVCDELYFSVRPDGRIRRLRGPAAVDEAEDLTVRAARLLQKTCGVGRGVDIRIDKRLPLGGGLGGGSSDAATTLCALDRLWALDLGTERLADLGLRLGADVPVFLRGRAAWGEGVGEELTAIVLPEPWYLVIVPPVTVSTAAVFSDPRLTRDTPRITIADFLSGSGRNDCEAVVRRHYPAVAQALDWLVPHARARLTGTGACVFAALEDAETAYALKAQLPSGWEGFVARGLNRSPLQARCNAI
jgi:4-diphosphocytidyl-2-C-methyl-D-erythritol kinase